MEAMQQEKMIHDKLIAGFNKALRDAGEQIKVSYFYQTVGSVWDDEVNLTLSGASVLTSGIVFPVSDKYGSEDAMLLEQGRIGMGDKKLYVAGSLAFVGGTGSLLDVRISLGASANESYSIVWGGIPWQAGETDIYKKLYIRKLPTGSLIGE